MLITWDCNGLFSLFWELEKRILFWQQAHISWYIVNANEHSALDLKGGEYWKLRATVEFEISVPDSINYLMLFCVHMAFKAVPLFLFFK